MLGGFGGATTNKNINGRLTSLCLIGGVDCTNGRTPDLKIKGGTMIKKTLCVFGNIYCKQSAYIKGNLNANILVINDDGFICGNLFVDTIKPKNGSTIDLIGNVNVLGNITAYNTLGGWIGTATSNLDMQCYNIGNVMSIKVNDIFSKNGSSVNLHGNTFVDSLFVNDNSIINGNLEINGCITNDTCVVGNLSVSGNLIGGGNLLRGFGSLYRVPIFYPTGSSLSDSNITQANGDTAGNIRLYINSTIAQHGSNAGIQYNTLFPNRAQIRLNAYGQHTGVSGLTSFKSRGTSIGTLAPVAVNDDIFRMTAIGVTSNNSIPLSGQIRIITSAVPPGMGYIGTDFAIELVSKNGPSNGTRKIFRIDSEGILHLFEQTVVLGQPQNGCAGLTTLDGSGNSVVLNQNISSTTRITLTIQDGGAVPTTSVYVSNRVIGTSFTISSIGGGNSGVIVYYQLFEPSP